MRLGEGPGGGLAVPRSFSQCLASRLFQESSFIVVIDKINVGHNIYEPLK